MTIILLVIAVIIMIMAVVLSEVVAVAIMRTIMLPVVIAVVIMMIMLPGFAGETNPFPLDAQVVFLPMCLSNLVIIEMTAAMAWNRKVWQ